MSHCNSLIKKPKWIRISPTTNDDYAKLKKELNLQNLHTICQEGKCPNMNECWSSGTATIMILGDVCTRGCRFCNVKSGNPKGVIDTQEPLRVAEQISQTNLKYIVITCVDRDDLADGGAELFGQTIEKTKILSPQIKIEALISDYAGNEDSLDRILKANPDVLAHNMETTQSITPLIRDGKASYHQSLELLKKVKLKNPQKLTKTSLMLGLGEDLKEVIKCCEDLKKIGLDIITFGQYLRPSKRHYPVKKYYKPKEFSDLDIIAREMGFLFVASGPLVRSSYKASELFLLGHLKKKLN